MLRETRRSSRWGRPGTPPSRGGAAASVMLARHLANGTWSAPVAIGSAQSPVTALVGVDARGTVTAVWSDPAGSVTTVATWLAAAATPSLSTLAQFSASTMALAPVVVTQLAVNASGAAVMAGESGPHNVAVAYRASAGGSFDYHGRAGRGRRPRARCARRDQCRGAAVLLYRQDTTIWVQTALGARAVRAGGRGQRRLRRRAQPGRPLGCPGHGRRHAGRIHDARERRHRGRLGLEPARRRVGAAVAVEP